MNSRLIKIVTAFAVLIFIVWMMLGKQGKPALNLDLKETNQPKTNINEEISAPPSPPLAADVTIETEVQETKNDKGEEAVSECWKRIRMQNPAEDFLIRKKEILNQTIGDWYFSKEKIPPAQENSLPGKFLLALAEAGFLTGKELSNKSDDTALKQLAEVYSADPTNSAPLVFAAMIEKRRGNEAKAQALLNKISSTAQFNAYMIDISRSLFSNVETGADLSDAFGTWSRLPIPNYTEIRNILKESPAGATVAMQMMQQGLRQDVKLTDIDWMPIEYAVGKKVLNDIDPENEYPDFRSLLRKKMQNSPIQFEDMLKDLEASCDLNALNSLVDKLHRHLEQQH